jgi:hypothetical protein
MCENTAKTIPNTFEYFDDPTLKLCDRLRHLTSRYALLRRRLMGMIPLNDAERLMFRQAIETVDFEIRQVEAAIDDYSATHCREH